MYYNIEMCVHYFKKCVYIFTFLFIPQIVNIWPKEVKLVRLQIGLELITLTLYIVIVSFSTNEENEKYIFN